MLYTERRKIKPLLLGQEEKLTKFEERGNKNKQMISLFLERKNIF